MDLSLFIQKKMPAFPLKDNDCTMKNKFLYYIKISKGEQNPQDFMTKKENF